MDNNDYSTPQTQNTNAIGKPSTMMRSFMRLVVIVFVGCCLMPIVLAFGQTPLNTILSLSFLVKQALLTSVGLMISAGFYFFVKKLMPIVDEHAFEQAQFLDRFNIKYVDIAILAAAALSLFLELAIIRWHSTVLEFFAFYKNYTLIACFVGLGLGYALANRDRIPLFLVIPLLAWQFAFMIVVRFGLSGAEFLRALPIREQLGMGIGFGNFRQIVCLYALMTLSFAITVLTLLPIGQLCGRLMERRKKLRAYGLNLLGSLAGVLLVFLASLLWTPPLVWFAPVLVAILLFHPRRPGVLVMGILSTGLAVTVLAWPVDPLRNRVYSPYQLLEVGPSADTKLSEILAAGHYYQRIYDLSGEKLSEKLASVRRYYDFPFKVRPQLLNVAVVGAGTGNDVAAALRAGAVSVDAIEIDPAILQIGKANHPEKPYDSPRVHAIVNDARSFLRTTDRKYDLIVYGLLDSHTLLSHGSSVRLDSFVYTLEGLREARSRLKPDGVIALSFSVASDEIARKIYLMMEQVFDGRPPISVMATYDRGIIFLESNDKNWKLPPNLVEDAGFVDRTAYYANSNIQADVSTDDWPFFYMPRRVYPTSYMIMVVQVLILSFFLTGNFFAEKPKFSHLSFFFLGAGFMLVETKGITEMGLTFGNTWQVIGVVVAGILMMAWLGNCAVQWLNIRTPMIPYFCLWATLALGWFLASSGGFPSTAAGRVAAAVVLTCPLFFSGIIFSTLLESSKGSVSGIMAMNLLGAICGGLLEYNSMYFGFQSLYAVAMVCYALAFISDWAFMKKELQQIVPLEVKT
jgi:spermidine synthase